MEPRTQEVKVDPIFIAQQFERVSTGLDYMEKGIDEIKKSIRNQDRIVSDVVNDVSVLKKEVEKVESLDGKVSDISKDVRDISQDVRVLKESKAPKMHPIAMVGTIVGAIGVTLALIAPYILAFTTP